MTYGLDTAMFIENGPAARAEQVRQSGSIARSWTLLDRERRLVLVERALRPTGNCDARPVAL